MMGNIIAKEGNFILTFSAFSSYWKGHVGSQWIRGLRSEVVKLRELILHLWQNIQQIWFPIKKLHHQRKSKPHLWIRVIQILKGPGWLLPAQTSVTLTFFFFFCMRPVETVLLVIVRVSITSSNCLLSVTGTLILWRWCLHISYLIHCMLNLLVWLPKPQSSHGCLCVLLIWSRALKTWHCQY